MIGTKLKNGATVLAYRETVVKRVVAADFGADHGSSTPFATWRLDEGGNAFWGHYFETAAEAVADLDRR